MFSKLHEHLCLSVNAVSLFLFLLSVLMSQLPLQLSVCCVSWSSMPASCLRNWKMDLARRHLCLGKVSLIIVILSDMSSDFCQHLYQLATRIGRPDFTISSCPLILSYYGHILSDIPCDCRHGLNQSAARISGSDPLIPSQRDEIQSD